jgi:hypothetical protein
MESTTYHIVTRFTPKPPGARLSSRRWAQVSSHSGRPNPANGKGAVGGGSSLLDAMVRYSWKVGRFQVWKLRARDQITQPKSETTAVAAGPAILLHKYIATWWKCAVPHCSFNGFHALHCEWISYCCVLLASRCADLRRRHFLEHTIGSFSSNHLPIRYRVHKSRSCTVECHKSKLPQFPL